MKGQRVPLTVYWLEGHQVGHRSMACPQLTRIFGQMIASHSAPTLHVQEFADENEFLQHEVAKLLICPKCKKKSSHRRVAGRGQGAARPHSATGTDDDGGRERMDPKTLAQKGAKLAQCVREIELLDGREEGVPAGAEGGAGTPGRPDGQARNRDRDRRRAARSLRRQRQAGGEGKAEGLGSGGAGDLVNTSPTTRLDGGEPLADQAVRRCRSCGCTDEDCRSCIERTGEPCRWVEADLCSACVPAAPASSPPAPLSETERHARSWANNGLRVEAGRLQAAARRAKAAKVALGRKRPEFAAEMGRVALALETAAEVIEACVADRGRVEPETSEAPEEPVGIGP